MSLCVIVESIIRTKSPRTIGDIRFLVRGKMDVPRKQIYNAIGSLTRRGHVRRIGYGLYASSDGEAEAGK